MGDDENNPGGQGTDPAQSNESAGASETPVAKTDSKEQSLGDRKNAAKAFYRALYSGEDVVPDDFGIGNKAEKAAAPTGPCPNCARFEAEAKESEKKATENENFYKRIAADFENYRRRNDREREEAVGLGIQKAIESILPALDDLDRAKTSLTTVTDPKAVVDSLNLVFARFAKCLEPLGVKTMDVVGEHFDPKFHEPVQEVKTTYFADGAVAQELRRGYMMREKVIRPALVNVASNESGVITPMPASIEQPAETDSAAKVAEETGSNAAAQESKSSSASDAAVQADSGSANAAPEINQDESAGKTQSDAENNADNNGQTNESDTSAESEKSAADQAANKQRAANALERLRKPNPKSTAELPAYRTEESDRFTATADLPAYIPEESERITGTDEEPQPVKVAASVDKSSDEDEAAKDASNNSD